MTTDVNQTVKTKVFSETAVWNSLPSALHDNCLSYL